MGRPTKIEGNPEHPGSLGGTDVFAQASVLTSLRSRPVTNRDSRRANQRLGYFRGSDERMCAGNNLRKEPDCGFSPKQSLRLRSQLRSTRVLKQFPEAKWHQYEQCGRDNVREGAKLAFGKPVNPVYKFDKADVIVSLDADFLTCGAGHVRYARDFSSRRAMDNAFGKSKPALCRRIHAHQHGSHGRPSQTHPRKRGRRIRRAACSRNSESLRQTEPAQVRKISRPSGRARSLKICSSIADRRW